MPLQRQRIGRMGLAMGFCDRRELHEATNSRTCERKNAASHLQHEADLREGNSAHAPAPL